MSMSPSVRSRILQFQSNGINGLDDGNSNSNNFVNGTLFPNHHNNINKSLNGLGPPPTPPPPKASYSSTTTTPSPQQSQFSTSSGCWSLSSSNSSLVSGSNSTKSRSPPLEVNNKGQPPLALGLGQRANTTLCNNSARVKQGLTSKRSLQSGIPHPVFYNNNNNNFKMSGSGAPGPPPGPKPPLMAKKASLCIQLSNGKGQGSTQQSSMTQPSPMSHSEHDGVMVGSSSSPPTPGPKPTLSVRPRQPLSTRTTSASSIPKLMSSPASGQGQGQKGPGTSGMVRSLTNVSGGRSPTSPTKTLPGTINNGSTRVNSGGGASLTSLGQEWKVKYEESEKKRTQLVALAQKATRDYEELRRRYQDLYTENEKLVQKVQSSSTQLETLRRASEAAYDEYYKLKKRCEVENLAKSEALTRVDLYNKENRRLKRQSAALLQQVPGDALSALEALVEVDSPENDKEIGFLRARVQELESKVINLETELETTRLAEFETQESVMLMTEGVQSSVAEVVGIQGSLKEAQEENLRLRRTIGELTLELESVKAMRKDETQRLQGTDAALRKAITEKNVLQRQSLVFLSNPGMDAQLHDALNQISELQFCLEEQRLEFESQILEVQGRLNESESQIELSGIETQAKIQALEDQVQSEKRKGEEAQMRLEEFLVEGPQRSSSIVPAGPPPPPPPPPPPMPSGSFYDVVDSSRSRSSSSSSLSSSLRTVSLRRPSEVNGHSNGSSPGGGGQGHHHQSSSPDPNGSNKTTTTVIDDVISQLKKGIKLRPMDQRTTLPRSKVMDGSGGVGGGNLTEESFAVEEMRSILNNLKRTRRTQV